MPAARGIGAHSLRRYACRLPFQINASPALISSLSRGYGGDGHFRASDVNRHRVARCRPVKSHSAINVAQQRLMRRAQMHFVAPGASADRRAGSWLLVFTTTVAVAARSTPSVTGSLGCTGSASCSAVQQQSCRCAPSRGRPVDRDVTEPRQALDDGCGVVTVCSGSAADCPLGMRQPNQRRGRPRLRCSESFDRRPGV